MRKPIAFAKAEAVDGKVVLTWYASTPLFEGDADDEFSIFRVYRREEKDFTFGHDYAEYFLGVDGADAGLLYEGEIEPSNGRKYTYTDVDVTVGTTYSYFVQTKNSGRVGPFPAKVRDLRVWWPYTYTISRLEQLVQLSRGQAELDWCGTTGAGRKIPCLRVGGGAKTLGLAGLVHAGEAGPELIIPAIEHLVRNAPDLLERVKLVAIPSVNIDAREEMVRGTPWYLRVTPLGVDINRNFPVQWDETELGYGLNSSDPDSLTYRGPSPASAPETQAVVSVFSDDRPDIVFSLHCLASICGMPALTTRLAEGDAEYSEKCRRIIESYAKGLYPEAEFQDSWFSFACTAGSLPSWLYQLDKIPTLDVEGCAVPQEEPCRQDKTDITLLQDYQERHARAIETVIREHLI